MKVTSPAITSRMRTIMSIFFIESTGSEGVPLPSLRKNCVNRSPNTRKVGEGPSVDLPGRPPSKSMPLPGPQVLQHPVKVLPGGSAARTMKAIRTGAHIQEFSKAMTFHRSSLLAAAVACGVLVVPAVRLAAQQTNPSTPASQAQDPDPLKRDRSDKEKIEARKELRQ